MFRAHLFILSSSKRHVSLVGCLCVELHCSPCRRLPEASCECQTCVFGFVRVCFQMHFCQLVLCHRRLLVFLPSFDKKQRGEVNLLDSVLSSFFFFFFLNFAAFIFCCARLFLQVCVMELCHQLCVLLCCDAAAATLANCY